ncbi:hypothetical protein D9M71_188150 [compost metagenome]
MKWLLIQVQPYCRRAAICMALSRFCVHTEDARPYSESLAQSTACDSSSKRVTVTTGPNTSRWTISSFCLQPASKVGW